MMLRDCCRPFSAIISHAAGHKSDLGGQGRIESTDRRRGWNPRHFKAGLLKGFFSNLAKASHETLACIQGGILPWRRENRPEFAIRFGLPESICRDGRRDRRELRSDLPPR